MKLQLRLVHGLFVIACLLALTSTPASSGQTKDSRNAEVKMLRFGGTDYHHRWSKDGQNEFTPQGEENLSSWRNMVTINLHETVGNGDQLAELANRVLSNYQRHGKILRTDSKPRTADHPAEHLIVAVLGDSGFLEAAFARVVLKEGVGVIAVYSHRVYGKTAGPAMSEWLKTNGPQIEKALLAWDRIPTSAALKKLPQSK